MRYSFVFSMWVLVLLGVFCGYMTYQVNMETSKLRIEVEQYRTRMALPIRVTVTCYNSDPAQTDSTPFITAFNWRVRPGIIAVSIDLLEAGYVPGSKVYIKDFGVFTVGDIMNDRFSNRVDIWVPEDGKVFKYDDVLMVPVLETA